MDMGEPSIARAQLDALIAAAAPAPLPAHQAIALLKQLRETDAAVLGRLAYHALTGVAPGEGDPDSPVDVAPGFPPFAAEVLMRAIAGPDHRRPTAQALLIVLDTVPAASWPTDGLPEVELPEVVEPDVMEPEAEPVTEAVVPEPAAEPVAAAVEVVVPDPEPAIVPEVEVDEEVEERAPQRSVARALEHQEFRDLLTPTRSVPRFDPLTDPLTAPWYPDNEDGPFTPPARDPEPDPEPEPEPVIEPLAESLEPVEPVEPVEPDPEPEVVLEVEPEPVAETEPVEEPVAVVEPEPVDPTSPLSPVRGMHDEFRDFASPSFAVPQFEPLEGELPAGSDRVRRRRGRDSSREPAETVAEEPKVKEPKVKEPKVKEPKVKAPKEPREPKVANGASHDDRHQTLLLVAIIAVLILVGVLYATSRDSEESPGDGAGGPQGASRSMVQPASAAV